MKRTHTASLYRRGGAVTEDTQGREVRAWGSALATDFPCNLQPLSGSLVMALAGKDPEGKSLLFVHPAELPGGVEIHAGDGIVVTAGRSPYQRYLVEESAPIGELDERWDDEFVLDQTEEAIP